MLSSCATLWRFGFAIEVFGVLQGVATPYIRGRSHKQKEEFLLMTLEVNLGLQFERDVQIMCDEG